MTYTTYLADRNSASAWRDEDRAMAHQSYGSFGRLKDAKQALIDGIVKEVAYLRKNGLEDRAVEIESALPDITKMRIPKGVDKSRYQASFNVAGLVFAITRFQSASPPKGPKPEPKPQKVTVIRAAHYGETEERLTKDPIVVAMAKGLEGVPLEQMVHDPETPTQPRFEFMQAANAEYRERGGKDGGHIGAIAHALLILIEVWKQAA